MALAIIVVALPGLKPLAERQPKHDSSLDRVDMSYQTHDHK